MKLNLEQIKAIATGAVRINEEDGIVRFYRFTKEEELLYQKTNESHYSVTFATAGIRLVFKTNSKNLFLDVVTSKATGRTYFSLDVFADGKPVGYIDNYSDMELPQVYTLGKYPLGEFSKEFSLGDGEKTVCIYLPWSVCCGIKEMSVDDGAFIEPQKPQKKLLAYGDSITQGYDALRSSKRYVALLADALLAEETNKAIGGEVFFPELAEISSHSSPDFVTIAYGTNDWVRTAEETFKKNSKAFYSTISEKYPNAKIFVLTPIWRKDMFEEHEFGEFSKVEQDIKDAARGLKNVTVISGFDFVPQNEKFYADLRLHPNNEGFEHYFANLYSKIK